MEATPANPLNPSNPIGRPTSKPQTPSKTIRDPLTPTEQQQIEKLLDYAEAAIHRHELETAVKAWAAILDIRVDHPEALAKATKALYDNYFTEALGR